MSTREGASKGLETPGGATGPQTPGTAVSGAQDDPQWVKDAMPHLDVKAAAAEAAEMDFLTDLDLKALDVDPDPSPNPGAAKLRRYWTRGAGAAKIRWGVSGDFNRCVRQLRKYVTDPKGLCNVYHRTATGSAPGQGPHLGGKALIDATSILGRIEAKEQE